MPSFKTKTSDRWSEHLTPAGILDMALRGTEEQSWELYRAARQDAGLRAMLSRLMLKADPELEGGRRLWTVLLQRMDNSSAC